MDLVWLPGAILTESRLVQASDYVLEARRREFSRINCAGTGVSLISSGRRVRASDATRGPASAASKYMISHVIVTETGTCGMLVSPNALIGPMVWCCLGRPRRNVWDRMLTIHVPWLFKKCGWGVPAMKWLRPETLAGRLRRNSICMRCETLENVEIG